MADTLDLLQGTLDLLVLKTLTLEPMHGWGISQRIQTHSRSVLDVNQGRLSYRLTLVATEQEEAMGRALLAAAAGDSAAAATVAQAMRDYARFTIAGAA